MVLCSLSFAIVMEVLLKGWRSVLDPGVVVSIHVLDSMVDVSGVAYFIDVFAADVDVGAAVIPIVGPLRSAIGW